MLYEVREARAAFEFDDEYMGNTLKIADEIEPVMQQMQSAQTDNNYEFKDEDLPFMPLVINDLPVPHALLNVTHADQ